MLADPARAADRDLGHGPVMPVVKNLAYNDARAAVLPSG
jgi:hypothetical protein